jgi:AcrR family transcriptional regulator
MEAIAEEADVAIGSLYGHFGSKQGLYLAVLDRALELYEHYMDGAYDPGLAPDERLLAVADAYVRFYREHPGFFRLFVFPPPDGPEEEAVPAFAARVSGRVEAETRRLEGAIRAAVESGLARPVDARRTAVFLWGAWNGVIAMHLRSGRLTVEDDELEEVLAQGREIITAGMLRHDRRNDL